MTFARDIAGSHEHLVRYLLDLLPDDEAQPLDEATIVDDRVAARLRVVEDDLVDDYVRGALDAEMSSRFESHYMASPRRRRRVAFAAGLATAIDRAALTIVDDTGDDSVPIGPEAVLDRTPWSKAVWPLTAAALLVVVCGLTAGYLQLRGDAPLTHRGPSPVIGYVAPPPTAARETTATAARDGAIALTLWPQTRSLASIPEIVVRTEQESVRFRLRLEAADFAEYAVHLADPETNHEAWQSGIVRPSVNATESALVVDVPASLLTAGHYSLTVAGLHPRDRSEPIATYVFGVDRR